MKRLFKKKIVNRLKRLNPFEVLVIVMVVIGTVGLIKFFGREVGWRTIKIQVAGKDWTDNQFNYYGYKPPYWLVDKVKVGDNEYYVDGRKIAEVVRVESYERRTSDFDLYLTVKIKGELNKRTNQYMYKSQPVETGAPIVMHLDGVYMVGQVIDDQVSEAGYEVGRLLVTAKYEGAESWEVNKITKGESMVEVYSQREIGKVIEVKTVPTASQVLLVNDSDNQASNRVRKEVFLQRHPDLVDVILTLEMEVEKYGGVWYFGGHQNVKVGNLLWLYLDDINLLDVVIQDVEQIETE